MLTLLKRYKKWLLLGAIPYLVLLFPLVWPTNFCISLPGDIRPIDDVFELPETYEQSGTFNSVFVISWRNSTILQNLLCEGNDRYNIYEIDESQAYVTNEDNYLQGKISKDVSIKKSIISVYNILENVNIEYTYKGHYVYQLYENAKKSDNELKIGDIILGTSFENVKENIRAYINNEITSMKILRETNGEYLEIDLQPTLIEENDEKYLGVYFVEKYAYYDIETIEPEFKIIESSVGGDSGGLLQALGTYNKLVEFDYTLGLTIAGTGAIELDGTVTQIGAIKQKIFTADFNNVDIFFCPAAHYEEAMIAYNQLNNPKMVVVSVETFDDAINYLENLAIEKGLK